MILGLSIETFLVLILLPLCIVAYMFYHCWLIKRGLRD